MNIKYLSMISLIVVLILNACSPFMIASSSGEQPTPVEEFEPSESGYQPIAVDNVDVEVGVGSPIPVHAIVGLNLANTCAQVGEMRLHREGSTFYIRLIVDVAQRDDCQTDPPSGSLPFRMDIPLNMVNLPDGSYEVNVNGATTNFDWPAQPTGGQ